MAAPQFVFAQEAEALRNHAEHDHAAHQCASHAAAIANQKTCPVMDEPLGGMGVPCKVNVNGKAIYICCPDCAKKLAAEPVKYLAALKAKGVTPPAF